MDKIKVLLVDDDRLAVSYMKSVVDWEALGYEIAGTAYNGRQALTLAERCSPQLIITDIIMPHMNGIQLCKRIKEKSKETRVVLLTAYGEFEYAREAVQIGVDYYLIKDEINENYLKEKLGLLKDMITDTERLSHMIFQKAIVDYFQLGEEYVQAHYQEKSLNEFFKRKYDYILIEQDFPMLLDAGWELPASEGKLPEILEQCLRIAEEGTKKIRLYSILPENRILLVLETGGKSEYEEKKRNYHIGKRICGRLNEKKGFRFTVYVTDYQVRFAEIYRMLTENREQLQSKYFLGTGRVYGMMENQMRDERTEYAITAPAAEDALAGSGLSALLEEIWDAFYLKKNVVSFLLKQYTICYQALLTEERKYTLQMSVNDAMSGGLYDFREIQDWLEGYYDKVLRLQKEAGKKACRPEVEKALRYLNEHYREPQLKISQIAGYLGISESRLCVIFKEDTKMTIIQCLTALRIEKAKRLLKTTDYKIYEIAELVGYSNSQYLSQVFYKETGCFPLDYKNRNQDG